MTFSPHSVPSTYEALSAFMGGRTTKRLAYRTTITSRRVSSHEGFSHEALDVRYIDSTIATFWNDGQLDITLNGWATRTTVTRLNAMLGDRAYIRCYVPRRGASHIASCRIMLWPNRDTFPEVGPVIRMDGFGVYRFVRPGLVREYDVTGQLLVTWERERQCTWDTHRSCDSSRVDHSASCAMRHAVPESRSPGAASVGDLFR